MEMSTTVQDSISIKFYVRFVCITNPRGNYCFVHSFLNQWNQMAATLSQATSGQVESIETEPNEFLAKEKLKSKL